jgi:futalosine hydrolase
MKIYIISATQSEYQQSLDYCKSNLKLNNDYFKLNEHQIKFAVHGVGILESTYHITNLVANKPDLIIQMGIAGSFKQEIGIGNVYVAGSDRLADLGAQDNHNFIDVFELGLTASNVFPYSNGWLFNTELDYPNFFKGLMHVNAITVNTATGNQATIDLYKEKYRPTLESMEGAALHYVALQNKIPFVQLRAISNYVTVRDKSAWQIPLAIKNLNDVMIAYITQLGND